MPHRPTCAFILSAICFLLVQSAVVLLPAAASAEWSENNTCPFAPGAMFPPPLYWTSDAGAPYVPSSGGFTYGATYPQAPLPSDFIATTNWGDGTTAPATVEEPLYDCYTVSGPSHTYANPGTYSFSYTVDDLKGGVNHTLDAQQLHVRSNVPLSFSGPPIPTNEPTAAAPAIPTPDRVPDEKPQLKFIGQPIAAAIPSIAGHTNYEIVFRLNEQLPRTKSGRVQAQLIPYGVGNPIASFGPHESHACYAVAGMRLAKRHPKAGRRYTLTLTTQGLMPTKIKGHAILHRYFNFVSMISEASKRLDC